MPYLGQRPSKGDENNFKILDDISSYTLTFDGSDSSVVSAANDTITSLTHRFAQGQRVTYNKGGGTVITGLSDGVYYIIKEDHNTIKLATSASNASNGIAVNITGVGAGSSHTLNVAFDGVNTKFKATHTNGQKARITRSAQLVISMNGVIQQPHDTATPSTGFGFDLDGTIVFSQAPVSTDIFWAHVLTNNNVTFDISNNDIDNFTGDGSTTEFNLSKTPPDNRNVLVTVDGVVQYPNDPDGTARAYVVVENVLTFNSAPASSVEIQVRHIGFAGSTSGSSGVTNFYGRTGAVVLKNTDDVTVNDAAVTGNLTVTGDLTVNGTTTTLDTNLIDVDKIEVAAAGTNVAVAITQSGTGDILNLYDGSTEVFSVADGGKVDILATNQVLTLKKATNGNYCGIELDRDNSGTEGGTIGLAGGTGHFITSAGIHDLTIRSANGNILFGSGTTEVLRTNSSGVNVTGTLTLPDSIIHTNDTNTKIRFPAAGTFTVETGGAERIRITSGGSVNIATTNSRLSQTTFKSQIETGTNKLISFGDAEGSLSDKGSAIIFSRPSNGAEKICAIFQHTNQSLGIAARDDFTVSTGGNAFYYSAIERLRINSAGRVGIGSTGTDQKLQVSGNIELNAYEDSNGQNGYKTSGGLIIGNAYDAGKSSYVNADRNAIIWQERGLDIDFGTTDTFRMKIQYDGKVGIGTISPDRFVHIRDASGGNRVMNIEGTATSGAFLAFLDANTTDDSKVRIGTKGGNKLSLRGDEHHFESGVGTSRAFIDSNGKFGIGDFSSGSVSQALHVKGSQPAIFLEHTGGYDMTLTTSDGMGQNGITVNGGFLSLAYNNKNIVMCRTGGSVGINSTSPREKLDIGAGRIILDQGYQFTWANGSTNRARIHGDSGNNFIIETGSSNTEQLRINSSGALLVKGDANPNAVFDRGSANTTNVNLNYNGTLTGQIGAANQEFQLSAVGASTPMAFYVNGDKRLHITTDGRFSLGTINATPNAAFHLDYDSNNLLMLDNVTAATQKIFFAQSGGTHAQIYGTSASGALTLESDPSGNHNSSYMNFKVDTATAMHIEAGGDIAIGNFSTPSRHLHIKDEGQIRLESTATGGWTGLEFLGSSGTNNYDGYMGVQDSNGLFFIDNNSNGIDFCINRSGKVFIGADSTDFSDAGTFLNLRNNTYGGRIGFSNNTASSGATLMEQFAYWGTNKVAGFIATGGTDTTNKDDGELVFYTRYSGASTVEALRIKDDGEIRIRGVKSGNSVPNVVLTFDILNSNGDSKKAEIKAVKTADVTSELVFSTTVSHAYAERLRIDSAGHLKHTRPGNSSLSTTSTDVSVVMAMQAISNPVGRVGTTSNHSTEVVANNVPAFSVNSSAEIIATTKSFVSKFPDHNAEQLTGGWGTSFNTIISPGTLMHNDTYIISAYWQHDGNGGNAGTPYLMQASFLFSSVSVNNSTAGNVEFIPLQTAHVGGGSHRLIFRMIPGTGHTTAGIQVKSASGFHATYGKITTKACRIADF